MLAQGDIRNSSIQTVMAEHEDCRFYDNGSMIDSCYMLTSEYNLNGTCVNISEASDNFYYCEQNNLVYQILLIPLLFQGLSYYFVGIHDCPRVHLCSGSS